MKRNKIRFSYNGLGYHEAINWLKSIKKFDEISAKEFWAKDIIYVTNELYNQYKDNGYKEYHLEYTGRSNEYKYVEHS